MVANPYGLPRDSPEGTESSASMPSRQSPGSWATETTEGYASSSAPVMQPCIDVVDDHDELRVYVDLPGFTEEDIQIQGDEQNLVVSATRREDPYGDREAVIRERPRRLERTVALPTQVDLAKAEAEYDAGVCEITLPKRAAEKMKEITFRSD